MLSQHDYSYYADGKIATWQEQTDSNTPLLWTYGYDAANQLTSAVLTNTAITSPPVRSDTYNYDAAGNPSTFDIGTVLRSPSSNALNQLTGSTPSGNQTVVFTGALNGAATVTVNGSAATVNTGHYFNGSASLVPGTTTTVPVVATDAQGNSRTNHYQTIVPAELTYSPTYDNDGNELTNGAEQTYTWDAKDELMSIVYTAGSNSGNHTEFAYDALGRRVAIVEKTGTTVGSGTVTSTRQLVWNGNTLAEGRDASNTVTKRFFAQGEQIGSSSYYYTRDHLGSIREMTDSAGAIQARYDYDPYGRAKLIQGTLTSDFQYAGYYQHAVSRLNLTLFRAYDPNTAKWLSRDPIGERGGNNLYAYVMNNPLRFIDPRGEYGGPSGTEMDFGADQYDSSGDYVPIEDRSDGTNNGTQSDGTPTTDSSSAEAIPFNLQNPWAGNNINLTEFGMGEVQTIGGLYGGAQMVQLGLRMPAPPQVKATVIFIGLIFQLHEYVEGCHDMYESAQ